MHIEDHIAELPTFAAWRAEQPSFGCSRELDTYNDWYVVPCGRNRDPDYLGESNFHMALERLGGESETVTVCRFRHWAAGWTEIILAHPQHGKTVAEITCALADYPILDDEDFSERERIAADEVWAHCYKTADRIAYIRAHRSQFEFHDMSDLVACARGKYFCGYASELLS